MYDTKREEGFSSNRTVRSLENYICEKRGEILQKLRVGIISSEKEANEMVVLLDEILAMEYFYEDESLIEVFYLVKRLKKSYKTSQNKVETLLKKVTRIKEEIKWLTNLLDNDYYLIPDESIDIEDANNNSIKEKSIQIRKIEQEIEKEREFQKKCHALQGIIARGDGFFENIL